MGGLIDRDGPIALAAAILRDSADLHGAACRGLGPLYDPDVSAEDLGFDTREDREAAVANTCITCPVRGRCWAWAEPLKAEQRTPVGPTAATFSVAGVLRPKRSGRPPVRAAESPSAPSAASVHPEPGPSPPRRSERRGARSRVQPSRNRSR